MNEIKTRQTGERLDYASPMARVTEVAAQSLICASPSNVNDPWGGTEETITTNSISANGLLL